MDHSFSSQFSLELKVRDYELDAQAIVNNSVYQNYLEHCRHEFLRELEIDFAALHKDGIDPVVIEVNMKYLRPLESGDIFRVELEHDFQGRLRHLFYQRILRSSDGEIMVDAIITAAILKNGRPYPAPEFRQAIETYKERLT